MALGPVPAWAQTGSPGGGGSATASGASGTAAAQSSAGPIAAVQSSRRNNRSLIAPPEVCVDENNLAARARAVSAMACMTNYARRSRGLRKFRVKKKLNRSADRKAADMIRCGAFSHTACGRPFDWWIKKKYATRQCYWAGENIAWGSPAVGGVRSIFKAWMKSPGHRSAILSKRYTDLGIGLRGGSFKGRSQARVWVQHFSRLC